MYGLVYPSYYLHTDTDPLSLSWKRLQPSRGLFDYPFLYMAPNNSLILSRVFTSTSPNIFMKFIKYRH